jgi:hypothetical protein
MSIHYPSQFGSKLDCVASLVANEVIIRDNNGVQVDSEFLAQAQCGEWSNEVRGSNKGSVLEDLGHIIAARCINCPVKKLSTL